MLGLGKQYSWCYRQYIFKAEAAVAYFLIGQKGNLSSLAEEVNWKEREIRGKRQEKKELRLTSLMYY